ERYTDVTVACEGKFYPAHKLVLSTCSDYFLKMFERTPCKHPIIVVKDVQCRDIEALLSYMYAGVVSVAQNDLAQLIKAAELLQIKGLAVPDEPPTTNKKSAHSRGSTDDRSSPHPKRQRREDNKSPSQNDGQTLCSAVSSPHSSPFRRDSEYSQEQTATIKHTNKGNQRVDQKLERRGDGIRADQLPEQHASQGIEDRMECPAVTKESPEAQVEMMDDSLVKEEILEPENDGDVSETGFEYGALVSNLMVDSGGGTKDQPNLSASSNFSHPPDDEPFVSQAGPSGLQGWSSLGDGGDASSQGYCGDLNQELSLQGLPGTQPQQTHHLNTGVFPMASVEETPTTYSGSKVKSLFEEKLKTLVDKSCDRSDFFTDERYDLVKEEVKEAKRLKANKEPLSSKHYRRLKRFDVITIGEVEKLIEKALTDPCDNIRYYCRTEDLFDALEAAHTNTGHKRTRVMEAELKKKYCNITRQ
ncbi:abrupt-like 7, partial [Homarus americanus]